MKRILCSLLVATPPFSSVLADAPKSTNAKVYQYELPNVPGKTSRACWSNAAPAATHCGPRRPSADGVKRDNHPAWTGPI